MELYLFRHGIAEDPHAGLSDADRQLTDEGRKKTAAVARLASRSGVQLTLIASSPLIRARQTAEIAAKNTGYEGPITTLESLVPDGSPERVWADVRDYSDEPAILLAGHEPLMGRLSAYLLNAASLQIDVKKASLIRIDFESLRAGQPHGILRWMIVPRLAKDAE
jgi:phosphohistidine phosphatase